MTDEPCLVFRHFVEYSKLFVEDILSLARSPRVGQALTVAVDIKNLLDGMV
jgi:hypothetical protein